MTEVERDAQQSIKNGVFSSEQLRAAVGEGWINAAEPVGEGQLQPASLDLRLSAKAYRLRSSFLPGRSATVEDRLKDLQMGAALDLGSRKPTVLERGRPYLIPLQESLSLPVGVRARANPRSSTGRLDLFTRVITDNGHQFDEVREGYQGQLWLEVYSNSFTIGVLQGLALAQLRISKGMNSLTTREISFLHDSDGLLFLEDDGHRAPTSTPIIGANSIFVSVSLQPQAHVGWKARRDSGLLPLHRDRVLAPEDYWLPVYADRKGRLILEPEDFYLLISREYVSIPSSVAAEMVAYDPTNGELRTHYAGFFDPGFGVPSDGTPRGTRAVLEVRAHDVPFMLEDGQPIARLAYEAMSQEPDVLYGSAELGSHFQGQEIFGALSRQFTQPQPRTRFSFPTGAGA